MEQIGKIIDEKVKQIEKVNDEGKEKEINELKGIMDELTKELKEIKLLLEKQQKKDNYNNYQRRINNDYRQKNIICYNCEKRGHIASNCNGKKEPKKRRERNNKCRGCDQYGHFSRNCTE
jgi:hypothetical protein